MVIIDHGLQTLTHEVIVPHSGWEREPNEDSKPRDAEWTTVFKNTSGCLRCGLGWGIGRICGVAGAAMFISQLVQILGAPEPHPKSQIFKWSFPHTHRCNAKPLRSCLPISSVPS